MTNGHERRGNALAAWMLRLTCASLLGLGVAGAGAAPQLVPLVDPPSNEHHVGKFVFVELVTPDVAAAKAFYGALFGWTFHDVQLGRLSYAEASLDGRPVAGIVERPIRGGEQRQPAWLDFVAVSDVDAARATAVRGGGRVLLEPHDVPGRGRIAVLADRQGAVFGVLASTSGDPSDELPVSGEWIWASLYTSDPEAAAGFYQALFDYEVFDPPEPASDHQLILASGGYARAAVNPLPAERTHPHWLGYVRVEDATASAARAVALGGKVLLTPRDDRHGGKLAIVADRQGAPLGLLEWPEDRDIKVAP